MRVRSATLATVRPHELNAMYENWLANSAAVAATLAVVALCVVIHYEGLLIVSGGLAFLSSRHQRIKVLYSILTIVLLHVAEIWVFDILFWLLPKWPALGHITGQEGGPLVDAIYLSAVTFSTVGYGDIAPVGPIRLLAGTEALLGLVLITWSASFTYLEMDRYWRRR